MDADVIVPTRLFGKNISERARSDRRSMLSAPSPIPLAKNRSRGMSRTRRSEVARSPRAEDGSWIQFKVQAAPGLATGGSNGGLRTTYTRVPGQAPGRLSGDSVIIPNKTALAGYLRIFILGRVGTAHGVALAVQASDAPARGSAGVSGGSDRPARAGDQLRALEPLLRPVHGGGPWAEGRSRACA